MNIKCLGIALGLLLNLGAIAQFDFNPNDVLKMLDSPLESDRPGQAMNSKSCGIMTIQLQTGGSFTRLNADPNFYANIISVPTQLKFGITRKLEINTSFSFVHSDIGGLFQFKDQGFPSPSINLRYTVLSGQKWKPYLGFQAGFSPSSSRGSYQQPKFGSSFYLLTSNRFDKLSINTNVGFVYTGYGSIKDLDFNLPYVLNFGYSLGDKWSVFLEGFGDFSGAQLNLDGGIAFLATPNFQLDALGGWLGNKDWFAEVGLTWKYSMIKAVAKKKIKEFQGVFGN